MIRKILWYWGPPLALMAIIFFLSSRQSIAVTEVFIQDFIIFKSLHVMEYAALTGLLFRALYKTTNFRQEDMLILAVLIALMYGITDELHQTFVPTRSGSLRDIFIDSIGISGMSITIKRYINVLKKYMY